MTAGSSSQQDSSQQDSLRRQEYTLQEWLQWQETLHPSVIDLGLARIRQVAQKLFGENFLSQQPFTITVGGTNGKGSCVTTLAVLLSKLGKRVGSFTSPHLVRYNERIRINNEEVSDTDLCAAFSAIDIARNDTSLTYFEFNALAAFWLFQRYQVDVQVLEVGLGGRLDAANLVDAGMAVITNIALDHVEWLGDTREKIGMEKAGILREQGRLVYGEADMPASIRGQAERLSVAVQQLSQQFFVHTDAGHFHWHGCDSHGERLSLVTPALPLPAPSVACALQVLAWLGWWDADAFAQCLPGITLGGRMERVHGQGREWILDVAHNEAGAQFLAQRLALEKTTPVTAVFSAMADKDLVAIFSALAPAVTQWILFPLVGNPRAASLAQLEEAALAAGIDSAVVHICDDVAQAVRRAATLPLTGTTLVCGSFFTVSAVKECIT